MNTLGLSNWVTKSYREALKLTLKHNIITIVIIIMIIDNIMDEVDSLPSNEAESNNIEAQVILLWNFKHY